MKRSSVYYSSSSDARVALEEVCSKIEKEGEDPILMIFLLSMTFLLIALRN